MRHGVSGRKLSRSSSHRRALATAQATALLREGRIQTTLTKAKELRPYIESLITTAKKAPALVGAEGVRFSKPVDRDGNPRPLKEGERMATAEELATMSRALHLRRLVAKDIHDRDVLKKLFEEVAPKLANRNGGYTRILRTNIRRGDAVQMALIEIILD